MDRDQVRNLQNYGTSSISPIPPIIEAAVKLYAGMDVFEIGHAAAAQEDLEKTTKAVIKIVEEAGPSAKELFAL